MTPKSLEITFNPFQTDGQQPFLFSDFFLTPVFFRAVDNYNLCFYSGAHINQ